MKKFHLDKEHIYKISHIEEWKREGSLSPLYESNLETVISLVTENGYEHLIRTRKDFSFEENDRLIEHIMRLIQTFKRKRVYSLIFTGANNGIILIARQLIKKEKNEGKRNSKIMSRSQQTLL